MTPYHFTEPTDRHLPIRSHLIDARPLTEKPQSILLDDALQHLLVERRS